MKRSSGMRFVLWTAVAAAGCLLVASCGPSTQAAVAPNGAEARVKAVITDSSTTSVARALEDSVLIVDGPMREPRGDIKFTHPVRFFASISRLTTSTRTVAVDIETWRGDGDESHPWAVNRWVHWQRLQLKPHVAVVLQSVDSGHAFTEPTLGGAPGGLLVVPFDEFASRFNSVSSLAAGGYWVTTDASGITSIVQQYNP